MNQALPEPKYVGDGEWQYQCNREGCDWWCHAFTEGNARLRGDQHVEETHGITESIT